jgi:hypothetical protein
MAYSVVLEMNDPKMNPPKSFDELIHMIQYMTLSNPPKVVNEKGKSILVRLFPSWLLPAFQIIFAKPFPSFSAWMNTWVTHWATRWLMGPSKVYDVVIDDQTVLKEQGLLVEKCLFLESSGCIRTCTHACKIPTQRFFLESMGIPVSLKPNLTDYSCKFEFGVMPLAIENDESMKHPCLKDCQARSSYGARSSRGDCLSI